MCLTSILDTVDSLIVIAYRLTFGMFNLAVSLLAFYLRMQALHFHVVMIIINIRSDIPFSEYDCSIEQRRSLTTQ